MQTNLASNKPIGARGLGCISCLPCQIASDFLFFVGLQIARQNNDNPRSLTCCSGMIIPITSPGGAVEWAMIELQGAIESAQELAGLPIGNVSIDDKVRC